MFNIKSRKMALPLCLCVVSMLLSPTIVQAASDTGSIAANQAADQKAALAKKAADRQKLAEEKQKAAAAEEQKEKSAEK